MNNRDWFCLALRLFGILLLIGAIETFPHLISYLFYIFTPAMAGQSTSYLWTSMGVMVVGFLGRTAIGLAMLFFASAIATRFYPNTIHSETAPVGERGSNNELKPLKIGLQLLAVYALLLALQSLTGVVVGILSGDDFGIERFFEYGSTGASYLSSLMTFGLNLSFALALLIWNEHVVTFITKFRYVAERDAYEPPPLEE